jgi:hypothetical protein
VIALDLVLKAQVGQDGEDLLHLGQEVVWVERHLRSALLNGHGVSSLSRLLMRVCLDE